MTLDIQLFHFLNNLAGQSPIGDGIIVFFATYVPYLLMVLFVGLLAFSHYPKWEKAHMFLVIGAGSVVARFGATELIRLFIHRPRPFLVEHPVHALFTDPAWSFPSGHATFFFALAMAIYLYHKRWGTFFFIAAAFVSIARVAAGVHYPSDIVAGAIVGTFVAYGVYVLGRKFKNTQKHSIESLPNI